MFDLFLATAVAFGSESVNATCSSGVCSVVTKAKKQVATKVAKHSRLKGFLRGKKCR